jgi:hypothetical protein
MKKSEITRQGLDDVGFIGGGMRTAKTGFPPPAVHSATPPFPPVMKLALIAAAVVALYSVTMIFSTEFCWPT